MLISETLIPKSLIHKLLVYKFTDYLTKRESLMCFLSFFTFFLKNISWSKNWKKMLYNINKLMSVSGVKNLETDKACKKVLLH
jgi:hypothetical protein